VFFLSFSNSSSSFVAIFITIVSSCSAAKGTNLLLPVLGFLK
jgi:hypothetical protein